MLCKMIEGFIFVSLHFLIYGTQCWVVLVKESWVWLVGLLVHLCGKDLLKKLGDAFGFCGGG